MKLYVGLVAIAAVLCFSACTDDGIDTPEVTVTASSFEISVNEGVTDGDVIGTVQAETSEGSLAYELISVSPDGAIAIDANVGTITVADAAAFESNPVITGEYQATSGEVSDNAAITITVIERNITASDFMTSVVEDVTLGQVLGNVDVEAGGADVVYELLSTSPTGAISLDEETGSITVADVASFDFATIPTITGEYQATAGNLSDRGMITINVTEVASGPVEWTGPEITFTKEDGADHTDVANQDRLTDNVILTRANQGQIFNIAVESTANKDNSPVGTEWAFGSISDGVQTLTFQRFRDNGNPKSFPNRPMVMHLLDDDIYVDVTFTQWSNNQQGGFAYSRSTE